MCSTDFLFNLHVPSIFNCTFKFLFENFPVMFNEADRSYGPINIPLNPSQVMILSIFLILFWTLSLQ